MVQTICKKVYDTETSTVVKKFSSGTFGDPKGFEETLYQTHDGFYFLYENGGKDSIHPAEKLRRMSKAAAEEWLKSH